MELQEIVDRLYALPLAEFTAARNSAARSVTGALQKRVRSLRKPTAAAHAVNLLVRERSGAVGELLDLGSQLRAAMGGDARELRRLAEHRRGLIAQLVDPSLPAAVQQDVAATLEAATADPEIAAAVCSGRLVKPLRYAGFGELPDLEESLAFPLASSARPDQAEEAAASPTPQPSGAGDRSPTTGTAKADQRTAGNEAKTPRSELAALRRQVLELAGAVDDAQRRYELAVERAAEARQLLELAEAERAEAQKAARAAHAQAEKARRDLGRLERS
ncbi:MAG TPA: hypothetical protein VFT62_09640 [Mycobacteriales bacterium]|nr:hypothetical protein [Mycobacteriales bacterium]